MSVIASNDWGRIVGAGCICLPMVASIQPALAGDMNAGAVEAQMDAATRYAFMSGVAEGLAYSRYVRDGKQGPGMGCIYAWFYADGTAAKVDEAFKRFPDYMPAPIMLAMAQKECGE